MHSIFIEFNMPHSDKRIAIMLDEILFIKEFDDYTAIYAKNGDMVKVGQSYTKVFELINKALKYV